MGDNDWVIWNVDGRGRYRLRDSFDRLTWTVDIEAGLAFDTHAEAQAVAGDRPGSGIVSQRGWVKDLRDQADRARLLPPPAV